MKATGIVRRVDDLGRVIIPKEIRRTLRIREGDPLEIFTDRDGQIIFQKYSPIGTLKDFADSYGSVLSMETGNTIAITDGDTVVSANGRFKRDLQGKCLSESFVDKIYKRNISKQEEFQVVENENPVCKYQLISPVVYEGDVLGSIVMFSDNEFTENDFIILKIASNFLGKQQES